jgi:hypothetical protein
MNYLPRIVDKCKGFSNSILANVGATTENCPYKSGKYLTIIRDFMEVGAGLRARPVKISFS